MAKSKLVKANEKIAEGVVGGYKKIEEGVVGGYKKIEEGAVGALLLGVGMCLTMVWSHMAVGIIVGIVGIVVLLCLIPFIKGLK